MKQNSPADIPPLLRVGASTSPGIEKALGLSQATVSRYLRQLINEKRMVRIGATRGARYGLLRDIEGIGSAWSLRRVNPDGHIQDLGTLHALAADEYYFEPQHPGQFAWGGLARGLPYFIQDQRPDGFLGRAVPQLYPELKLPQRVADWNDDHYLRYLTLRGADTVGDLILGDTALDQHLLLQSQRTLISSAARAAAYPRLVEAVMGRGLPGSSAHGEHPKFAAVLHEPSGPRPVLVKFSPLTNTSLGQRWSDLLVAEHLAHVTLAEAGVASAQSRIERVAERTYLELTRFDRAGLEGRIGVTSLLAIDTAFYGALDNWIAAATRLHKSRRINDDTLETIRLVATFGGLIANTDRHFGNLAFYDHYDGKFTLAPIYDMLPMLFAPQHEQIIARTFEPPPPTSETLRAYGQARALAETYWDRLAHDPRINDEFRAIASVCGQTLARLPNEGAYARRV